MQRVAVIFYQSFGTSYHNVMLPQSIGKKLPLLAT